MTYTEKKAGERILLFAKKHSGQNVLFQALSEDERYEYVLTKTYLFFVKSFGRAVALKRAIRNADCHMRNGYEIWCEDQMEHIVLPEIK